MLTLAILVWVAGASTATAAPWAAFSSTATPPTAAFTSSPATPTAGQTSVAFDASASNDPNPGGSITNYSWDFGDGSTDSTSSATDSHVYNAAGSYMVTLTVTDIETDTAMTTQTVTVYQPPAASFTSSPGTPTAGQTSVAFDGTGSSDPNAGGSVTSYVWDFGDGSAPGTGATPHHTYTTAGTYTITLTVTDLEGGQATSSQSVTVAQAPSASFTSSPGSPTAGQTSVAFDGHGSNDPNGGGSINGYSWDFGDGSAAGTGATPNHTYTTAGTYTVMLTVTDAEGGTATTSHAITVAQPPSAAFTSSSPRNVGQAISFDGSGSNDPNGGGSISSYSWNFGDGSAPGTGATPSHAYSTAGSYTITLSVTDAEGGTATTSHSITVTSLPPTASFTFSPTTPTAGQNSVSFDASASNDPNPGGSITNYSWDFGDGSTDSTASPTDAHLYTVAGTYTIMLTVTDLEGGSASTTQTITVAQPPTAAFTISSPRNVGLPISFDGRGCSDPNGGSITSYTWDFGDGATGTGATPTHTYAAAGPYTITLTVTDSEGGTATTSHAITVSTQSPTASFTSSPPTPTAGQTSVSFDGSASNDPNPGGSITNYSWDFGDGSALGSGATPSHTYATAGTFTVMLTVTDAEGGTASTSHTITVARPPTAAFTSSPSAPTAGQTNVAFNGSGSNDPNAGGSITSYSWDFGDGATGTGATPSHTYAAVGSYTVTLIVIDAEGGQATISHSVTVVQPPTAAFTSSPATPTAGQTSVAFDGTGSSDPNGGSITNYSWDFGDGSALGSGATPHHTYATAGTFTVTLTVTDSEGGTATTSHAITVAQQPTAAFTVSSPQTVGQAITFDGTGSRDPNSGGSITSYSWNFGDGSAPGTGATPSHIYATAGTFTATLTVTDSEGGTATTSHAITVSRPPTAAFTSSPSTPTAGQTSVAFDGTTSKDPNPGGSIVAYSWDFGDGSALGSGSKPSHTYAAAGNYTVVLTVTDAEGAQATISHSVTVVQPPTAAFTSSPATPTAGQTSVGFDGTGSSDPNGGSITSYSWNFGDASAPGTGATPHHTYATAGSFTITLTVTDSEGGTATTSHAITVAQQPTAAFTDSSPHTTGQAISFDGTGSNDPNSGGSITSYSWNFGDGSPPGTGATLTHTYSAAGTYTATLTVTDSEGGTATTSHTITVSRPPTASFTFSPTTPAAGGTVSFDGSGSSDPNPGGSITSYSWDFGDGATGSGARPSHVYTSGGNYTITLTVTDAEFGQASTTLPIHVSGPQARFTVSTAIEAMPTTFDASSSSDPNVGAHITTYAWDFGDGTTDTTTAPTDTDSHTYTTPGTYTVTLTITDSIGQTASITQTITVADAVATAAIFGPSSTTVGTPVTFVGTRTGDSDDTAITYSWRFGDGKTATGPQVQHVYQTVGTYTVVLTITDDDGFEVAVQQVKVGAATVVPIAPTADFSASLGLEGQLVTFDGSPSSDPNRGGALGYRWNFGDGGIGAGQRVSHAFRAGHWTVTLTVTDSATGLTGSVSRTVTITDEPPIASFARTVGRAGHKVALVGSGFDHDGAITAYRWSFGDGSHARGARVAHKYSKPGSYTVTLTITDSSGQTSSVADTVIIGGPNACLVPALVGQRLASAQQQLKAAECSLGRLQPPGKPSRRPGKGKRWRLVVVTQSPPGQSVKRHGAAVHLTVVWRAMT